MKYLLSLALPLLLAGCASLGLGQSHHYYVLKAAAPSAWHAAARREWSLLVAPTSTAPFYDTQQIVFSREPGLRAYYQLSSWTQAPGRNLDALLIARLERAGAFRSVASAASGVGGSLLLSTHLDEIYHDAASSPGSAKVTLVAELSDPARRILVARRVFTASAPVASFDAKGAVEGIGRAFGAAVEDVVTWAGSVSIR